MTALSILAKGTSSPAASTTPAQAVTAWQVSGTPSDDITIFLAIGQSGVSSTGVAGLGATWSRIGLINGTGVGVEIWMGENPTAGTGSITATFAGSTKPMFHYSVICGHPGTWTASTPQTVTGSGTSVDPGAALAVTQAALVLFSETHASATPASASTDTPVAATGIHSWQNLGTAAQAGTAQNNNSAMKIAPDTTATKRVYTIPSSQYAGLLMKVTPVVASTLTGDIRDEDESDDLSADFEVLDGWAYRGGDTYADDLAGSY